MQNISTISEHCFLSYIYDKFNPAKTPTGANDAAAIATHLLGVAHALKYPQKSKQLIVCNT